MSMKTLMMLCVFLGMTGAGNAGEPVTVMSFNIRYGLADDGENSWDLRKQLVAGTIAGTDPDLLGVQECLGFQAEFLRGNLPGHGFVGAGRDDGGSEGEMCAVFWREDRFEKLDAGHFWLSPWPDRVGSVGWDAALTRMATWVKLRTRGDDPVTFLVASTHFDHVGEQARRESAAVVQRRLMSVAGDLPVILMGDFNAPADPLAGGPYARLIRTGQWVDTFRQRHSVSAHQGTFNGFRGETAGPRIDWILVRGGLAVEATAIVRDSRNGRFPSDHFPVTARIRLKR